MSKSLARVEAALKDAGLAAEIREMGDTRTAADAAAGCEVDQIAKSIIFRGEDSGHVVLFLTAGGNRVDAAKATALAGQPLGKADANLIRAETGFAIGGVAPVGHLTEIAAFGVLFMGPPGNKRYLHICDGGAGQYAQVLFFLQMCQNKPLPVSAQNVL